MTGPMDAGAAFLAAFGAVFVAELGDKTQLALLVAASRIDRPWTLFAAALSAFTLSGALAVAVGAGLGLLLPLGWLQLASGALFVAFGVGLGVSAWRRAPEEPGAVPVGQRLLLSLAAALLLAELGDKTQLTTGLLAATAPPWPVFAGATCALAVNAALAVAIGRQLRHLPAALRRWIEPLAAVTFVALGAVWIARGLAALV